MEIINKAVNKLKNSFYDERLAELYGTNAVDPQRERYIKLLNWHHVYFGSNHATIFSSPGRTELGGNHTDHNGGIVLAASIQFDSVAAVSKTNSNIVTLNSENYPVVRVDLSNLEPDKKEEGSTESLIRGIAATMVRNGYSIGGFDASVTSDVLPGSGLSSSASFEILIGTIFNNLFNDNTISITELSQFSKEAENRYFGKPCGLMDQLACGTGGIISIDFKNRDSPVIVPIDFNFGKAGYSIMMVDTGNSHSDLTDDYNSVSQEMMNVASIIGKDICRKTTEVDLLSEFSKIRKTNGDRAFLRALHFFRENNRVEKMIKALREDNIDSYLELVNLSGDSSYKYLQNCYSLSNPRSQGIPLALALSEGFLVEKGISRVHGGGFAGAIQSYVPSNMVENYKIFMGSFFGENSVIPLRIRKVSAGPVLLT